MSPKVCDSHVMENALTMLIQTGMPFLMVSEHVKDNMKRLRTLTFRK